MRRLCLLVAAVLVAAACTTQPTPVMPTLAVLPSVTPAPPTLPSTPTSEATVIQEPTASLVVTGAPTVTAPPTQVMLGDVAGMERRLFETAIFTNIATERVRSIFAQGRALGNRADVFTTIGDSNTTNGDFLQPIGMDADAYCEWGAYSYLRETVDYFSATMNSFTHHSEAARMGFNSASVLDPFWSSGVCAPGEASLTCEFRDAQPSVAVIMLGGIDINDLTTADYNANMRAIVQTAIQRGVIPVLTTFVVLRERAELYPRSLEFNMMLLDIADEEQIPLINLWAAAQALPDSGIGPDRTHLKARVGSFCSFDGAQAELGGTLRNLLTLQALDQLRQSVLAG